MKCNSNAFSFSTFSNCSSSTMQSSRSSSTEVFRRYWTIYILLLIVIVITNCVLIFFSFVKEESLAIKTFTMSALLPLPICLLESFFTRDKYIGIFSEVRSINSILRLSPSKHVMQLTSENVIKIILVLAMLFVQLAIIAVEFFIYESIGLNMRVNDIIMTKRR